jgi:Tfp pilus assembly protein PilO
MTITTPMKIVFALLVIILIGLGFWVMDWQKKVSDMKQLDTTLSQKDEEFKKNEELVKALPEEMKRKEELEKSLRSIIKEQFTAETEQEFVPSYLIDIEDLVIEEQKRMNDSDFTLLSLTPGGLVVSSVAKEEKKVGEAAKAEESKAQTPTALGGYPTRTFQMSMKGKYATLIDFLHQMGALKLRRLVTINRIALSPGGKSLEGMSPVLNINIPVTAYLRQGGK